MEGITDYFFLAGLSKRLLSKEKVVNDEGRTATDNHSTVNEQLSEDTEPSSANPTTSSASLDENVTDGDDDVLEERKNVLLLRRNTTRSVRRQSVDGPPFSPGGSLDQLNNSETLLSHTLSRKSFSGTSIALGDASLSHKRNKRVSIGTVHTNLDAYEAYVAYPEPLVYPDHVHPFKRKYPPSLLFKYPKSQAKTNFAIRCNFPNFLPMFAFPSDIEIQQSDTRPESTYHSFMLTDQDGTRLFGMCLVTWIPISNSLYKLFEAECETWRKTHVPVEERELAQSFSTKLITERSRLSKLLIRMSKCSLKDQRYQQYLSEEVSQCEERISVYTDLLKPVRHGIPSSVHGLTNATGIWAPQAYGILSRYPQFEPFYRDWLKVTCSSMQLDNLEFVSSMLMERLKALSIPAHISNLCEQVPVPPQGLQKFAVTCGPLQLFASRAPSNEIENWDAIDMYPLFRSLSAENIITLFEAALMECKIVFVSKTAAALGYVIRTLCQLIYPLTWQGLLIPVLPRRLFSCLEAPCSYIIGVEAPCNHLQALCADETTTLVICDLDSNNVRVDGHLERLPPLIRTKLASSLRFSVPMHHDFRVPYGVPEYVKKSYPSHIVPLHPSSHSRRPSRFLVPELLSLHSSSLKSCKSKPIRPVLNAFAPPKTLDKQYLTPSQPRFSLNIRRTPLSSVREYPSMEDLSRATPHQSLEVRPSSAMRYRRSVSAMSAYPYYASTLSSYPDKSDFMSLNTYALAGQQAKQDAEMAAELYHEGHAFLPINSGSANVPDVVACSITGEILEGVFLRCKSCGVSVKPELLDYVVLPCLPACFDQQRVEAAFLRVFTRVLMNYRGFLTKTTKKQGPKLLIQGGIFFNQNKFVKKLRKQYGNWIFGLAQTQALNEFMNARCQQTASQPDIKMFDEFLQIERNRGRPIMFGKSTPFLSNSTLKHAFIHKLQTPTAPSKYLDENAGVLSSKEIYGKDNFGE
ncbi:diacylglycerol binding protein [Schizosaccharomyces japonicus yFS275]|uniref:Diacylglycerol binding protein n=1 Tax=Schizosaccharomyces japonicus (strain yFS275 / FY16936) TaxID=402676 RepID=B6K4D2_SCHJY|nr:diacylglycerol binding protein [Schizosaccharomyces japonicus yFS275]EEB08339.1 diacylglycerol binding protein [Schizosaccharomyces japonicus yFS275]